MSSGKAASARTASLSPARRRNDPDSADGPNAPGVRLARAIRHAICAPPRNAQACPHAIRAKQGRSPPGRQPSPRPPSRGPASVFTAASAVGPALRRRRHRESGLDPDSADGPNAPGVRLARAIRHAICAPPRNAQACPHAIRAKQGRSPPGRQPSPRPPSRGPASVFTAASAVGPALRRRRHRESGLDPDRVDASIRRHRDVPWWCC